MRVSKALRAMTGWAGLFGNVCRWALLTAVSLLALVVPAGIVTAESPVTAERQGFFWHWAFVQIALCVCHVIAARGLAYRSAWSKRCFLVYAFFLFVLYGAGVFLCSCFALATWALHEPDARYAFLALSWTVVIVSTMRCLVSSASKCVDK